MIGFLLDQHIHPCQSFQRPGHRLLESLELLEKIIDTIFHIEIVGAFDLAHHAHDFKTGGEAFEFDAGSAKPVHWAEISPRLLLVLSI